MTAWKNLVMAFSSLPGIGPKMAERLALHFLRRPEVAKSFLESVRAAKETLVNCALCGDFVERKQETSPPRCRRCEDPQRDAGLLCVVEEIGDLQALERSRAFQGRYHVLGGVLSALDGIGPETLRIGALLDRIKQEETREVILATNPTAEGETTATYLADLLRPLGVSVTRLAYGLPSGSAIQYADEYTLSQALEGRRNFI